MKNNELGAATLLLSLIILAAMTLLVISSSNISTVNYRIAGNMQAQKLVDSAAIQGLEEVLSQTSSFSTTTGSDRTINVGADITNPALPAYTAAVTAPVCIGSRVMPGFSAAWGIAPEVNVWEMTSSVTDPATGAATTLHQGVKIQQLSGSCDP